MADRLLVQQRYRRTYQDAFFETLDNAHRGYGPYQEQVIIDRRTLLLFSAYNPQKYMQKIPLFPWFSAHKMIQLYAEKEEYYEKIRLWFS